jgi:uncharacterized protein YqgC (DUF456 family)
MIIIFTVVDADVRSVWGCWYLVEMRRVTYVSEEVLTIFIFKANSVAVLWNTEALGATVLEAVTRQLVKTAD